MASHPNFHGPSATCNRVCLCCTNQDSEHRQSSQCWTLVVFSLLDYRFSADAVQGAGWMVCKIWCYISGATNDELLRGIITIRR